jgi:hypothetical protein
MGFPGFQTDPDPQANPVNRLLQEMRDAGEVICHEPRSGFGEPRFSLPEPAVDAVDIKGNEAAKRQVLVAAAAGLPVQVVGPEPEADQFRKLTASFGIVVSDESPFTVSVMTPPRREREANLPRTSTGDMNEALAKVSLDGHNVTEPEADVLLITAARDLHLPDDVVASIRTAALAISRLDQAASITAAHMAEAINYHAASADPPSPLPEVNSCLAAPPPLVRPDRQYTFDGIRPLSPRAGRPARVGHVGRSVFPQ